MMEEGRFYRSATICTNRMSEVTDRSPFYDTPKRPKVTLLKKLLLSASIISTLDHLSRDSKAVSKLAIRRQNISSNVYGAL